ncbi:uncharacterized protein [Euwallacea fornicatus]|uniref:uncharacterized protein n=1 Tax=Euwallacea fornicatus TaxID=995702 RepID=UPI00338E88D5
MSQIYLTALVVISLVAGVLSRGCYQCNSYSDRDHTACIDPMSPYPLVNYTTCPDSNVCTRVSYVTQKQFVVSRSCDLGGDTCNNIYRSLISYYPDLSTFNCYSCSRDYCNDASGVASASELKTIQLLDAQKAKEQLDATVVNVV